MCGAHSGPDHDDPAASELCDTYHAFTPDDLPVLEASLTDREKEIVWQVALGIGPDAIAARLGSPDDTAGRRPHEGVRAEIRALNARMRALQEAS